MRLHVQGNKNFQGAALAVSGMLLRVVAKESRQMIFFELFKIQSFKLSHYLVAN
jgi:hypothetical protein